MRPAWEPRPDKHQPPLVTDHAFDGWTYSSTGKTICIHLQGDGICDRAEDEHAPAPEVEAGA
jgi:hypothetical protein